MGRRPSLKREHVNRGPLSPHDRNRVVVCCISPPFGRLSTTSGKVIYVVLTRAPLYRGLLPFSLDLHVLGAPLTFALSQDQTLQLNFASVLRRARTSVELMSNHDLSACCSIINHCVIALCKQSRDARPFIYKPSLTGVRGGSCVHGVVQAP